MNTRSIAFFIFSLLGLSFSPEAKALPPAKPTDGSVRFTRVPLVNPGYTDLNQYANSIFHSYHLRWKDNAPDADGTELQLRFANAGPFYFLTNTERAYLKAGIADITERDAEGYREAIVSAGSPPVGTICQFQIVTWKFNGTKTESSSLLIQTRVPASNGNADLAPPTNLKKEVNVAEDLARLTWEDKSDKETYYQIWLASGSAPEAAAYTHLGYLPFGTNSWDIRRTMSFPYNVTTPGQTIAAKTTLIPGQTYSVAIRAINAKTIPITEPLTLGTAIPPANANVTAAAAVSFTMPGLKAPTNLKGTVLNESTVRLEWQDNSNNETGYEIHYRPVTGGAPAPFTKFGDAAENVNSINIALGQLGAAEFKVRAIFAYRPSGATTDTILPSDFTADLQLSTTGFPAPTGLTAVTSSTAKTVDLTWEDNSSSELGFDVYCRLAGTSDAYNRCISVPSNVTKVGVKSFTSSKDTLGVPIFTDLTIGASYEFIVRAVGDGEFVSSQSSNTATATPQQGFTSRMYQPITQGVEFNHTVTTSTEAVSIGASGLPDGLTIVPSTGAISGIPTQAGFFPVTLTASFNSGPPAVSTLRLLVQAASTAPTIDSIIVNPTIGINQPFTISLADKFKDSDSETAVRWETTKGNIDFLLYPSLAPAAVANFMAYVNAGDYGNVFFHRHVANFVLQAGGFAAVNSITSVNGRPSPLNEPGISNLQWTISAAKLGARSSSANAAVKAAYATANPLSQELSDDAFGYAGNPDSATTDIFINLNNNASNLDNQNGGFTAYGRVSEGTRATVTSIQGLPVGNYGGALTSLPVDTVEATAPASPTFAQLVKINRARAIPTLTYTVDTLSPEVASVVVENNQLKLIGKIAGTRTVTVTAKDLDNKTVTQTFTITVDSAYQTPAITVHPVSQIVDQGATATLSVTATGTGLQYKWRKNGTDIAPTVTTPTLSLSSFGASDASDYDVIVYNTNTSLTSDKAILRLRSPANISGILTSKIVEVGKPLEIESALTGSPEPVCVWKRGTTIIAGQSSRKLVIPTAKLSDAGLYTLTASNAGGSSSPGAGGTATIIVVDKTTQYQNVKAASLVKLIAPVAGQGLTYQWKKGGLDIGSGEPGFRGQQDPTLIIDSVTTANVGDYTCVITAPAGLGSVETGIIRVSVPSQKPVLGPLVLADAFVGLAYRHQIAIASGSSQISAPGKFIVSGLPSGLICDVNTGLITGIPRATGNFKVRVTVNNAVGSAAAATSTLKVAPLVATASGAYVARVAPSQPLNLNLGGRLDIALTDNSAYTATLQLGGETFRSAGSFNLNSVNSNYSSGIYESFITFNRANRSPIQALLLISTSTDTVAGRIEGILSDGTNTAGVIGYRHIWSSLFRSGPPPFNSMPFAATVGSYKGSVTLNVALEPEAARLGQTDTPEGSGYLALTLTNGGTATAVGRLSDGTPVTFSTLISASAEMYLFQPLNLGTSSLGGFMRLSSLNYSQLSSDLRWVRGRQPLVERIYQPGFSPTLLSAYGALYIAPGDKNVLKISDIEKNALIKFSRGGLAPADPSLSVKLGQTGGVVYPAANPSKVSLILSPNTGLINGSFELNGAEKRKATYQGLIIPRNLDNPSGNGVILKPASGVGYFLLPGLTPTVATSAIKSGMVSMNGILITTQPSSQNVLTGANVTFSVDALVIADLSALTYQWQKNGVPLSDGTGVAGAATKTLTLETVDNADAADYTCLIKSGTEVQAITKVATLALVVSDVVASRTPNTIPLPAPTSVTFSVTAKGSGTLIYTWLKNGLVIPGATSSSFTIASTAAADDGLYAARVSSKTTPSGLTSNVVNLNINAITTVTASRQAPTDLKSIVAKTSVNLVATVSAGETVTRYQWRKDGVAIRGATASTYTFVTGSTSSTNNYDVLAINPLAPAGIASNLLPVTVLTPVSNVRVSRTSPTTAVVVVGSPFTLTAAASGGSLTYQWKKNNVDIPSETGPIYTVTPAVAETAQYSVTIKNPLTPTSGTGSDGVTSAALTVATQVPISSPVLSRTAPAGATVPFNTPVTLSVTASGTSPTYQWFRGSTLISGATNATYEFTTGAEASTTNYSVRVTNGTSAAGVLSNVLAVQVAPAP
jgi:cyclophilin family peptidyl-prolyl cis-trans isomerase